ncbi:MAG TPA: protein kinase [Chloroflexota bacterium]|nr:protein kinase [Chloroflexota bacterium]
MANAAAPRRDTLLAGRYLLQEEIGSGGMGAVYRATDLRTGGPVAVKLLHPAYARSATYRERLRREAQIAASLTSPRVVRIVDFDEHEGAPFLVEELVAGETLGERLARTGKLPLAEALTIAREVACALAGAHALGIVHRDLKLDNVKLVDGQVKVLDFGIARADGIPGLTGTDSWVGTVEYVAPERAQGAGDIRSDLYSLGVILFTLVVGRLPFDGPTPLAILRRHEFEAPPVPADLPRSVRVVLARCLAKDPNDRYPSPTELIAGLDEALYHVGGPDPPAARFAETAVWHGDAFCMAPTPRLVPPNNLPLPVTSFIGRQRERAALAERLTDVRALTLTGPGGVGKTRLALEVATAASDLHRDGAWLVPLAALPDPALVTQAIADALGVREAPGRELAATLAEWLRPRHLLLVLDNCEHVIHACATIVDALLQTCPHLRVLAASREPLGIGGEVVWAVPPLVVQSEAVELFTARAAAALPGFRIAPDEAPLVTEIVRRLDGLPLAIELAAARVKVLSLPEILNRLSDRFGLLTTGTRVALPRHQTLRAALDWSYDLLPEAERVLFRRLGVFARGFTLEAAEAVLPEAGEAVLDGLAALVDKSLLAHETAVDGSSRFTMLQTVREYALEHLRHNGEEEAVALRHLEHCVRLVEKAEPGLRGREQLEWLAVLDREHENLRAVLDWCADGSASPPSAAGRGLRLAAALGWYWYLRGQRNDGYRRLAKLLQRTAAADPSGEDATPSTRAMARALAAYLAFWGPDPARVIPLAEHACRQARAGGDALVLAWCLLYRAAVEPRGADAAQSVARWEEALGLFRAAGATWGAALCLAWLGRYAIRAGEWERARRHLEESHALFQKLGDRWGRALAVSRLASVAEQAGDSAGAERYLEEQQALARDLGHRGAVAGGLNRLAGLSLRRGDVAQAADRFEQSIALFRAIGESRSTAAPLRQLARLVAHQGDYARAEELLRESLRVWQGQDGVMGPIRSLLVGAEMALLQGKRERAARLLAAAEAEIARSRTELGAALAAALQREAGVVRRAIAGARDGAPPGGPPMGLADAMAYALEAAA